VKLGSEEARLTYLPKKKAGRQSEECGPVKGVDTSWDKTFKKRGGDAGIGVLFVEK